MPKPRVTPQFDRRSSSCWRDTPSGSGWDLPTKSPAARAATAFSLFVLREDRVLPRDVTFQWSTAQLRQMIQPAFVLLPGNFQQVLLERFWKRLGRCSGSPAMHRAIDRTGAGQPGYC